MSATHDKEQSDRGPREARLAAWAEQTIGGRVVSIEAIARWRPAWNFDLDMGDRVLALHARGERDDGIGMPYKIDYERRVHDLLEAHEVPVPHVYGYCEDPYAMVMDRLSGSVDVSFATSEEERVDVVLQYLSFLPRIYGIDLEEARAAGFTIPESPEEIGLGLLPAFEAGYDERMIHPDPVSEFLRVWLHRHCPRHRTTRRLITFDAFQFMFAMGRITGLIDFELAHVGDPLSELAVLPVRDTIKNLGDLSTIAMAWSDITGEELDFDVLDFHTIAYNAHAVLSAAPLIVAPPANGELMSYFGWYVNGARWAFERIAGLGGFELDVVDPPVSRPSRIPRVSASWWSGCRIEDPRRVSGSMTRPSTFGWPGTSNGWTRSGAMSRRPTSTMQPIFWVTDPNPKSWMLLWSRLSVRPLPTTRRISLVCLIGGCSASISPWHPKAP